jgi:hypothetical protein
MDVTSILSVTLVITCYRVGFQSGPGLSWLYMEISVETIQLLGAAGADVESGIRGPWFVKLACKNFESYFVGSY